MIWLTFHSRAGRQLLERLNLRRRRQYLLTWVGNNFCKSRYLAGLELLDSFFEFLDVP